MDLVLSKGPQMSQLDPFTFRPLSGMQATLKIDLDREVFGKVH